METMLERKALNLALWLTKVRVAHEGVRAEYLYVIDASHRQATVYRAGSDNVTWPITQWYRVGGEYYEITDAEQTALWDAQQNVRRLANVG